MLARLVPTEADRARSRRPPRIGAAREMSVVSEAGTDLRCPLGEFPAISEYGFVDEPGRWDHWPSGFVLTWPNEGGAGGACGRHPDRCGRHPALAQKLSAIELTVENGYATRIDGGVDAELLREYVASFKDPEAYAISHIGWGLQPRAGPRWACTTAKPPSAWTRGPTRAISCSRWDRTTKPAAAATTCHIDIPLRGCTVRLDERTWCARAGCWTPRD